VAVDGIAELERAAGDLAARIPPPLAPLARLAYNYRWSWTLGGAGLFAEIDAPRFERCRENPVRLLGQAPAHRLERAADDQGFVRRAEAIERAVAEELARPHDEAGGVATPERPIAFLCAEFGIHRSMQIYSGGLGVLAGDILKASSDLRLPLVGVGILYAKGNFHQRIDPAGWQEDFWVDVDPERLPAALVAGADGRPLVIPVPIRGREVRVQVWRVQVGRIPLFLLDADRPDNAILDRWITARLYVGDPATRLEQYAMLGIGGVRALRAMGIEPSVLHLNEGHAALAPLELARLDADAGFEPEEALAATRHRTVFTTHTPVAAGNEAYPAAEVLDVLGERYAGWEERVKAFGGVDGSDLVGMTSLGLRLSRGSVGVSRRHGEVARRMWRPLYPDRPEGGVPIGHVTNGVHVPTWMGPPMRELLDRYLGDDWIGRADDPTTWEPFDDIPDHELWEVRTRMRADLVRYVREADVASRLARYESRESVGAALDAFRPERLTLGFARRVATYKRLSLMFHDPDRVAALLDRPDGLQLVIAGKAHPKDTEAKASLAAMFERSWPPHLSARVTFLEDYDMGMAAHLVFGCDVWVNLPRPPMEASGTSGMKAGLNGALNLSTLDGWWAEGFDGANGWAVDGGAAPDTATQDEHDASSLYDLLEGEVLPTFHDRDGAGVPRRWVERVKASLRTIGTRFGASRMMRDYLERVYDSGALPSDPDESTVRSSGVNLSTFST
jgi:starch phosphorylase